jgi:L-ribulose-5-phosphate 4-epimerase
MKINDGYIKFDCTLIEGIATFYDSIRDMNKIRTELFDLGLIGVADGIGYGNISVRTSNDSFLISGSQTGRKRILDSRDYAEVISYNFGENSIICKGFIGASSESLTHAAVYEYDENIGAVIHIHHLSFWEKILNIVPTTDKENEFGTVDLAMNVIKLFEKSNLSETKIIAMGGHSEGIISFGEDISSARDVTLKYYHEFGIS